MFYCLKTKKKVNISRKFEHFETTFFVVWLQGENPEATLIFSQEQFDVRFKEQIRDKKGQFISKLSGD